MKVVLDTNVLVSGIFWKGKPSSVLDRWAKDEIQVFMTTEILKEVRETLTELDRTPDKALSRHWLLFILENSTILSCKTTVKVCRDPNDDKFLDCALSAGAKYIVSGDNDLLSLTRFQSIEIVNPAVFLGILNKQR